MLKRNIAILIAGGLLATQVNLAGADDTPPTQIFPAQQKYLEERAASVRADVVKINAATKYVNAEHLSKVKIVNDKGQSFTWMFDAGDVVFPLKAIAPAGFEAGDTTVYVRHPTTHLGG